MDFTCPMLNCCNDFHMSFHSFMTNGFITMFSKLENGDTVEGMFKDGLRHGICKVTSYRTKVSEIIGDYKDGTINGKAKALGESCLKTK